MDHFYAFIRKHCFWIALYALALLCDTLSTIHIMLRAGTDVEMHPIVGLVSRWLGPVWGPIVGFFGKLLGGILVAMYWRGVAAAIFLCASIISFWAAWFNLWGYQVYTPAIFDWWPF